jgi:hypothetical protein
MGETLDERETVTALEALERRFYQGLASPGTETLSEIMSDEFVYIRSAGIVDSKQDYLTGRKSGFYKAGSVRRTDGWIEIYGDMAVTTGVIEIDDPGLVLAVATRCQQTLVWVREQGAWRLLVRQATTSSS